MNNLTTAVVVARMQSSHLHEGYMELFNYIRKLDPDRIILVLGDAPVYFTDTNPLNLEERISMIRELWPFLIIFHIADYPDDNVWSINLDKLLSRYENITLYGSRDSFIKSYSGKNKTFEVPMSVNISSTEIRKQIATSSPSLHNKFFREGIIYSTQNRFPIVYSTVDIAPINVERNRLLLGRKPGRQSFCFIGGFVDKSDNNLEEAAQRELEEEVIGIKNKGMYHLSSHKIDDWRYRNTKDSIMTNLFFTICEEEELKAGDDIGEVKWFNIEGFNLETLQKSHHILFESLIKNL